MVIHWNALFNPASIAIIGASAKKASVGNGILINVLNGYTGKVYPVNPHHKRIEGKRCYRSILQIPHHVDLAVIAVPAKIVPTVVKECAEKKIRAVMVISAGFKETGDFGRLLEDVVADICKNNNMTLVGPNCLGAIIPYIKLNASFSPLMPQDGHIAFVSQSGALVTPMLDYAWHLGLGFSKILSIGNKALLDESDLLDYFSVDSRTKLIIMYVEQLTNARRFIQSCRMLVQNNKPLIMFKSGKSEAGAHASSSHTGSLAGSSKAYEALFKQAGVIEVKTIADIFMYAQSFIHNPPLRGNNIAIITNAGGPGIVAADQAVAIGLKLSTLTNKTKRVLKQDLPPTASLHNPIDLIGDADSVRYETALSAIISDRNVDGIAVVVTPQSMTDISNIAEVIIRMKHKCKKPLSVCMMGSSLVEEAKQRLQKKLIATYSYPEEAVKSLACLFQYTKILQTQKAVYPIVNVSKKDDVKFILRKAIEGKRPFLAESESIDILGAYGFPMIKRYIAKNKAEVLAVANKIHTSLAMKIVSPDIEHETDVGGVMLNVDARHAVEAYYRILHKVRIHKPKARIDGVNMAEMIHGDGEEMIVGFKSEAGLGKLMMFGLGGVNVEVLQDVAFRFAPLSTADIEDMMREVKAWKILQGFRKQPALDIDCAAKCLARLSQFALDFPEVRELDINPLFVLPKNRGVRILDARIILSQP